MYKLRKMTISTLHTTCNNTARTTVHSTNTTPLCITRSQSRIKLKVTNRKRLVLSTQNIQKTMYLK